MTRAYSTPKALPFGVFDEEIVHQLGRDPEVGVEGGAQRVRIAGGRAGRVYFPGWEGATVVIRSGPAFEVLARNTLDDSFDASPAPYAIAEQ